jgi:hypothetical protein
MRYYGASSVIAADAEAVWAVLSNGPGWATWDSGVDRSHADVRRRLELGPSFDRFARGLKLSVESGG